MEAVEVKKVLNLVPELLDVPYSRVWSAYDKEADVLYRAFGTINTPSINFRKFFIFR